MLSSMTTNIGGDSRGRYLKRLRDAVWGLTSKDRDRISRRRHLPSLENMEQRIVLAAPEVYAWYLINVMRANPAKFADELNGLYKGTMSSAHGMSKTDPVWTDLRDTIQRSSHPEHFDQALALMRLQPRLGPLALEGGLSLISSEHNTWMTTHAYAHSRYTGNPMPETIAILPGFPRQPGVNNDPDIVNSQVLGGNSTGSWGEDISYDTGNSLPATRQRFGTGTNAHRQRQAYADTIGFMIEVNSNSLGHLKNLLSRDNANAANNQSNAKNAGIGKQNSIGIDFNFYDSGLANQATNMLATHTLTTHRQFDGQGGYFSGVAYQDTNGNGYYDIGEGSNIRLKWTGPSLAGETGSVGGNNLGVFNEFAVENGRYTVEVLSGSKSLGKRVVNINDNNVWVEFRVSGGFGLNLTDTGSPSTPSMTTDMYESPTNNNNSGSATNLGIFSPATTPGEQTSSLSIHSGSDQDWFRFQVADGTARARILLGFAHSSGDIDAVLYRQESSGALTTIRTLNSSDDDESLEMDLNQGTYFLKVFGYSGATNFYSLTTDISVASPLYVDFGPSGLWRWTEAAGYTKIHAGDADDLVTGADGYLYVDFGPSGLWRWSESSGYTQIHAGNADGLAAGADGYLYVDFGPSGLWRWSATSGYSQIHAGNADGVTAGADGYLYVDFGVSGLWRWSAGAGYTQIHAGNADGTVAGSDGYLYVDFGVSGLWRWSEEEGYRHLHAGNADGLTVGADGILYVDFGVSGLWRWSESAGYSRIHAGNADSIVSGADGYLYIDFGPSGLWRWFEDEGYRQLHVGNPDRLRIR